jgi:hypothetical protein
MATPGVIGSATPTEGSQRVDQVVKQLRDLRNWHGSVLALVSLASIVLVLVAPRSLGMFFDFFGYTALGLLVTIVGISWAVKSFSLVAPRNR